MSKRYGYNPSTQLPPQNHRCPNCQHELTWDPNGDEKCQGVQCPGCGLPWLLTSKKFWEDLADIFARDPDDPDDEEIEDDE